MTDTDNIPLAYRRGDCEISTDPARLDLDVVHGFLATAYWSKRIPRKTLERAIRHSLCFGVYAEGRQVGFARVITDRATFAYLCDVFIVETHRGRGLGKWLMEAVMAHPDLQGLRRWSLLTRDAHGLYQKVGFAAPKVPQRYMEIVDPEVYARSNQDKEGPP